MSESRRQLIVNADDFGMSAAVNDGIARAFVHGVVTSASLMVRRPAAAEAASFAARHPRLGLGLHLDLGEWRFRDGEWVAAYEVVALDDPQTVRGEVESQLEAFHRLTARMPTHLDSHQHVHLAEPVRAVVKELGERLGISVRGLSPEVRYCGDFYGQTGEGEPLPDRVSVRALLALIDGLPEGCTELGCHPGAEALETSAGEGPEGAYRAERAIESRTLTDPRVRARLDARGVELSRFHPGLEPAELIA